MNDYTNGGVWKAEEFIPDYYMQDKDYKIHARLRLERAIGEKLFHIIEECRHPAVVNISELKTEQIHENYHYMTNGEKIWYEIRIIPVTMDRVPLAGYKPDKKLNLFQRIISKFKLL